MVQTFNVNKPKFEFSTTTKPCVRSNQFLNLVVTASPGESTRATVKDYKLRPKVIEIILKYQSTHPPQSSKSETILEHVLLSKFYAATASP